MNGLKCANVTYRFGAFRLDSDTRELRFDAGEVHLSPKAFELLTTLIVNRRRAVSKAELQEHLWPATFVEETNLAGLVAEIRRALRDDADHPAFVRTMYRFGYRFVGDVTEIAAAAPPPGPSRVRPCLIFDQKHVPLLEGANVIGREPDAAIQCDAAGVSRYHARIVVAQGAATIEDLGSKNGTFVRGERVMSAPLADGDEIRLGTARLTFHVSPPKGTTETVSTS
jgi:DNA-binding winged helix-turn-helix (wHTH) protein